MTTTTTQTITEQTPAEVGRTNAGAAYDQRSEYEDAFGSFYDNVLDTCCERHFSQRQTDEACKVYRERFAELSSR